MLQKGGGTPHFEWKLCADRSAFPSLRMDMYIHKSKNLDVFLKETTEYVKLFF